MSYVVGNQRVIGTDHRLGVDELLRGYFSNFLSKIKSAVGSLRFEGV